MAVNNIGNFTLEPGKAIGLIFTYGDGNGDHGAQYFAAHPIPPYRDASLKASDQCKILGGDNRYHYAFRITNLGPLTARFSVQGGGFC